MSDTRLQQLKRRQSAGGGLEAQAAYLRECARVGKVSYGALGLAAFLQHAPSRLVISEPPEALWNVLPWPFEATWENVDNQLDLPYMAHLMEAAGSSSYSEQQLYVLAAWTAAETVLQQAETVDLDYVDARVALDTVVSWLNWPDGRSGDEGSNNWWRVHQVQGALPGWCRPALGLILRNDVNAELLKDCILEAYIATDRCELVDTAVRAALLKVLFKEVV